MNDEIWKEIPGYDGRYLISSKGNVYSKHRNRNLKPVIHAKDCQYYSVTLSKKSKCKTVLIHRLVAEAFIPNPENKPSVNHIDGNRLNNDVDNLEWATWTEQQLHAYRLGLRIPNTQDNFKKKNKK